MASFFALSESTQYGFLAVAVLGAALACLFWRSHRAFQRREAAYNDLATRAGQGQNVVADSRFATMTAADQEALLALQALKANSRQRCEQAAKDAPVSDHALA